MTEQTTEERQASHRLPRTVEPRRYELVISPDLDRATFRGEEQIDVVVHEATEEIVLNALELTVEWAELVSETGSVLSGNVRLDEESGRAVIALSAEATPGPWTLRTSFSGTINDKLRGFYRSTYEADGTQRVIATTQFEATDARRAFPCWDEPDRKAVFSITLVVDRDLTAVSNTAAVEETDLGDGRRRVRFADTMPMSTYLVAFVVGPLELTDPVVVEGVPLRIAHVPGKEHLTSFALEVGAHALRFFSGWFGIRYPSDKLDLIALPDFAFGAMENLGAVTFRESVLLIDPAAASRVELERVADVISHEIAHMWFGDLVTMRWWNGLWLNEAFATFMELLCVDAFRPDWHRWVTFGLSRAAAMRTDGLPSTRPVEFAVERPEEAEGMFDVLTYEKGAGVLRMLERYLGAEPFRRGIGRYLAEHSHGNAETTDLWDAIEAASGEPARTTMDSWIFQGGHPVVTVTPTDGGEALALDQLPFRYLPDRAAADAIGSGWRVPVLLRAGVNGSVEEQRVLLDEGGASASFSGPVEWVVANSGGWGFYRVRYDGDLLARLTADLGRLDALERFNLVSDAWGSSLAGLSPVADFIDVAGGLRSEQDPDVWAVVVAALSFLDRVVSDEERPASEAFVRSLLTPAFRSVGWERVPGESERTGTLRSTLLEALGTLGADFEVRARSAQMHADFLADRAPLDPELAGAVVGVVASTGGEAEYDAFLDRFRNPRTPQEELRYLYALARFEEPGLVARTLELSRSEVRTQNAPFLIQVLLSNRSGGPQAWAFVKERWEELLARLPDNTIPRMVDGVSALWRPAELAADVRAFFAGHPLRSGQRTLQQTLERLDVNEAFGAREGPGLGALLARAREAGPAA
ncbi:MAG: M1 family metallopeptidase [Actinobacteria bacterium]|nr:MAG: M1 family metallopeptidase [Actinomycetota bacterium]